MVTLNWIFCNGHAWWNEFPDEKKAMDYVHICDMIKSPWVDQVYLQTQNGNIWIKESIRG